MDAELERLEQQLGELITLFEAQKQENRELKTRVGELQAENTRLTGKVEAAIAGSVRALTERDTSLAEKVITGDRDVNRIEPGDLVWVPQKGDPQTWQNLQGVLLVAAQVATIILAIRAF